MTNKNIAVVIASALAVAIAGYFFLFNLSLRAPVSQEEGSTQGKINIEAVCKNALAYMSFPDGASADLFVAECKEGKHPEVIEQYKAQMGLGDGATI